MLTVTCLGHHSKARASQQVVQGSACICYSVVCILGFSQNLHQSTDRIVLRLGLVDRCASQQRA